MRKRLAIVSIWFPPQQSVATNRILAFVDYLSEEYDIEVFAMDQEERSSIWNEHVIVHYSPSNRLFEKLKSSTTDGKLEHKAKTAAKVLLSKVITSPLKSWQRATSKKLEMFHAKRPFDMVISSFSPQEAHMAVIDLFEKSGKLPWVADMRDEMSMNPYLSETLKRTLQGVEAKVNQYATVISSVSQPILDDFKTLCKDVKEFVEVRNGFNHDFRRDLLDNTKNEVFTLGYFGSFYGARKPDFLFRALKEIKDQLSNFEFRFHVFGAHANFNIPSTLEPYVHVHQGLSYLEGIEAMAHMDLNVVMHPASAQKGIYTGKLFDYISVQKPVLALVDSSDVAAELVREFECGYVADFEEVDQICKQLIIAFEDWRAGIIRYAKDEQRDLLHRRHQIDRLKQKIQQILNHEGA